MQYYLIKDLLKYGADPNQLNDEGKNALHFFMDVYHPEYTNSIKIIELLMENGANPNIINKSGWSPVHEAAKEGFNELIAWMNEYNKKNFSGYKNKKFSFNFNLQGSYGFTPLHLSCEKNDEDTVISLIEAGANPLIEDFNGRKPSSYCRKNTFLVKYFKKNENFFINAMMKKNLEKNWKNNNKNVKYYLFYFNK